MSTLHLDTHTLTAQRLLWSTLIAAKLQDRKVLGHCSKILTGFGIPPRNRYLVTNLRLLETKHLINLPAPIWIEKLKILLSCRHFCYACYKSHVLPRKSTTVVRLRLFPERVDVANYGSIALSCFQELFCSTCLNYLHFPDKISKKLTTY